MDYDSDPDEEPLTGAPNRRASCSGVPRHWSNLQFRKYRNEENQHVTEDSPGVLLVRFDGQTAKQVGLRAADVTYLASRGYLHSATFLLLFFPSLLASMS